MSNANLNKKMTNTNGIFNRYLALKCDCCGKDLLSDLCEGIVVWIYDIEDGVRVYRDCYIAHKGECDEKLTNQKNANDHFVESAELSDFANPNFYRQHVLDIINRLSSSEYKYEDKALSKEKLILEAFAQKVFIIVSVINNFSLQF